jgi:hypothetical protein
MTDTIKRWAAAFAYWLLDWAEPEERECDGELADLIYGIHPIDMPFSAAAFSNERQSYVGEHPKAPAQ